MILLHRNFLSMRYPKTGSSVDLQMYNSADILLDSENALCSSQCHSENSNNSSSLEISGPSIIVTMKGGPNRSKKAVTNNFWRALTSVCLLTKAVSEQNINDLSTANIEWL